MNKIIPVILFLISIAFFQNCYYDNEETLYPVLPGSCDTTNVTYTATIAPIMSSYCTSCHGGSSPSGGIDLRTYDVVKSYANDIYGSMNHDNGYVSMPKGGSKLDDCTILKVKVWIEHNTPQ